MNQEVLIPLNPRTIKAGAKFEIERFNYLTVYANGKYILRNPSTNARSAEMEGTFSINAKDSGVAGFDRLEITAVDADVSFIYF